MSEMIMSGSNDKKFGNFEKSMIGNYKKGAYWRDVAETNELFSYSYDDIVNNKNIQSRELRINKYGSECEYNSVYVKGKNNKNCVYTKSVLAIDGNEFVGEDGKNVKNDPFCDTYSLTARVGHISIELDKSEYKGGVTIIVPELLSWGHWITTVYEFTEENIEKVRKVAFVAEIYDRIGNISINYCYGGENNALVKANKEQIDKCIKEIKEFDQDLAEKLERHYSGTMDKIRSCSENEASSIYEEEKKNRNIELESIKENICNGKNITKQYSKSNGWDCALEAVNSARNEVLRVCGFGSEINFEDVTDMVNKYVTDMVNKYDKNEEEVSKSKKEQVSTESPMEQTSISEKKEQVEVPTSRKNIPLLKIHNRPILRNYHIEKIMNNLVYDYLNNNNIDDLVVGIYNLINRVQSQEKEYEIHKVGRLLKIMKKVKELVAMGIIGEDIAKDIYKSTGLCDYQDIGKLSPLEYKKKYYSSELKDFHSKKIGSRSRRRSRRNSSLSYRIKREGPTITGSRSVRSISKKMKPVLKQKNHQEQIVSVNNDVQADAGSLLSDFPQMMAIKEEISSKIDELKSLNNAYHYHYSIGNDPNRTRQEVEKEQRDLFRKLIDYRSQFINYIWELSNKNPSLPVYQMAISEVEKKFNDGVSYKNPLLGQLPGRLKRDSNKFNEEQQMQQNSGVSSSVVDMVRRIDSVEKLEKQVDSVEKQISSTAKLTNNLSKIPKPVVNRQTFPKEQIEPLSNDNNLQTDVGDGTFGNSLRDRVLNAELSRKKRELSSATGLFEDNRELVKV